MIYIYIYVYINTEVTPVLLRVCLTGYGTGGGRLIYYNPNPPPSLSSMADMFIEELISLC